MLFNDVLGLTHIKNHLISSADAGRVPHAQLFVGPEGCGTLPMAIAYIQYLVCANYNGENKEGEQACNLKFNNFSHPDLHFAFPVAGSDSKKRPFTSKNFMPEWRQFLQEQPYGNLYDWYSAIGIEKKQGQISVHEAAEVLKKLFLKSYEGSYKVMLIWMAEKMNISASNKLLKLIEEPPEKTIFILIAEDEEQILQTIRSRCQILTFPPLSEESITNGLIKRGLSRDEALTIAHEANGNFNKALDLMNKDSEDLVFEKWFVQLVRNAFKAKGNKGAILLLTEWSDKISQTGRETQKKFLFYCIKVIRQAMLINYNVKDLAFMKIEADNFHFDKFARFIHENNVLTIVKELEDAIYHVERNGNPKIIFTDLSIKLTRLIHKKATNTSS